MVYVMLADGFEEIEAIAPIDVLRRAAIDVKTVGVTGQTVTGTNGVPILADLTLDEVCMDDAEMIVLPGGMPGTANLYNTQALCKLVTECANRDRFVAAICAAPSIILGGLGLLRGKQATCFPGMENGMEGAQPQDSPAVQDGKIITGRAAGAALDFGLLLVSALRGAECAEQIRNEIHYAE